MDNHDRRSESDIAVHIFTASAALVGVCLTVIGLFKLTGKWRYVSHLADKLLAVDAGLFLVSCILSYWVLRSRGAARQHQIERYADIIFLAALIIMAIVCTLVAYEYV